MRENNNYIKVYLTTFECLLGGCRVDRSNGDTNLLQFAQQVFTALPNLDVADYTNSGEASSPATM